MSPLLTAAVMYALGVLTGCVLAYIVAPYSFNGPK